MRDRKEIEEELKPIKSGNLSMSPCSESDMTMIELLLDIRDLLKPEITGDINSVDVRPIFNEEKNI